MPIRRGRLSARGRRFGVVVSRFNRFITNRLLESCLETLKQAGAAAGQIEVIWVPGALEVPYFCQKLARRKKFDALIALACVLRGGTYHFECVSHELTRGLSQAALQNEIPIATGIITADCLEDAVDRAGLKSGNKGEQAAFAALEIADLNAQISRAREKRRRWRGRSGRRQRHA